MRYDFDLDNRRSRRKETVSRVFLFIAEVIIIIAAAYLITHYGLEKLTVSSEYMSPTLNNDENILINKMSYKIHSIKRNDIVVIRQSGSEHDYYMIDRVIGLPGEKVRIQDGEVYIDDEKLKEKHDFPKMENGGLALEEITLDKDEYFVLCDNRNGGEDSRNANVGNILKKDIVGKAWIRVKPFAFIKGIDAFKKDKTSKATSEE